MSKVDTKFRLALLAKEKNRLMLAEEMRAQHTNSARMEFAKRCAISFMIIIGGIFFLQNYFDRAYDLAIKPKKQNLFNGMKLILGQIQSQVKNPKKGLIGNPPVRPEVKTRDKKNSYALKEHIKPKSGGQNSGYQTPSISQSKLATKSKAPKKRGTYRSASITEVNRIKKTSKAAPSAYSRVGTAIPWELAKNQSEFPDLR